MTSMLGKTLFNYPSRMLRPFQIHVTGQLLRVSPLKIQLLKGSAYFTHVGQDSIRVQTLVYRKGGCNLCYMFVT